MPYTFGNATFTQDDVIRRAQEKGLTLEEYLALNPEVKFLEEGNQTGSSIDATVKPETAASKTETGQSQKNQN